MKTGWIVLCGVLCSCLLTTVAAQPPVGKPRPDGMRGLGGAMSFGPPPQFSPEEKEKFRQRLGITVQQQEQMDALFQESDRQRRALGARLWELFGERQTVCDVYDYDRAREAALRREIGQVYVQILKVHSETEEKLRRILTRDQFDRLRALRNETMRMFRDGWRKGPGEKGRHGGVPENRP